MRTSTSVAAAIVAVCTLLAPGGARADAGMASNLAVSFTPTTSAWSLSSTLTADDASPIAGRLVTMSLGPAECSAPTDAAGVAACSVGPVAGMANGVLAAGFAGDGYFLPAFVNRVVATQMSTWIVYTGATAGDYADPAELSARLLDETAAGVAGAALTLSLGNAACRTTTDGKGDASCSVVVSSAAGPALAAVTYDGDGFRLASATTAPFTVSQEQTTISASIASTAQAGAQTSVGARLLEDGITPVAGRTVKLVLGGASCDAMTSATGAASCALAAPATTGPVTLTATFGGDGYYAGASGTATTTVFAAPPGAALSGAFVVGDRTATGAVTFWGSDWSKANALSASSAPSSFKGYAATASLACGGSFSTDTGASPPPPAGMLPAYLPMIVTSAAAKSGSKVSGTVLHVVVVKVDPGYDPSSGHGGTGVVVATIC